MNITKSYNLCSTCTHVVHPRCKVIYPFRAFTYSRTCQVRSTLKEFGGPRSNNFGLNMCLTLRDLVSRLVPLFLGEIICFLLRSKMVILQCLNPLFSIGVEHGCFHNKYLFQPFAYIRYT